MEELDGIGADPRSVDAVAGGCVWLGFAVETGSSGDADTKVCELDWVKPLAPTISVVVSKTREACLEAAPGVGRGRAWVMGLKTAPPFSGDRIR